MFTLENITTGTHLRGLTPDGVAKVVKVEWFGDQAVKVTFENPQGQAANRIVFRNEEATLTLVTHGRPWSFDGEQQSSPMSGRR